MVHPGWGLQQWRHVCREQWMWGAHYVSSPKTEVVAPSLDEWDFPKCCWVLPIGSKHSNTGIPGSGEWPGILFFSKCCRLGYFVWGRKGWKLRRLLCDAQTQSWKLCVQHRIISTRVSQFSGQQPVFSSGFQHPPLAGRSPCGLTPQSLCQ